MFSKLRSFIFKVDPEKAEEEKLQLITKSPELFGDYLEIKKADMNIVTLVKAGITPLLKSLITIDPQQQRQAQQMIIKAVRNFKKDFNPKLPKPEKETEI